LRTSFSLPPHHFPPPAVQETFLPWAWGGGGSGMVGD
jgi:hypothetical protein